MTRLLLFIKHRLPFLWRVIDWLNELLFELLYRERLVRESEWCFQEFGLDNYFFRPLVRKDLVSLHKLLLRQGEDRLIHFNPHGFNLNGLIQAYNNHSLMMFGVFFDGQIVGYFFLRCFWNRRAFVGRLIDKLHEKKGIGKVMNDILYHTAWRSEFRCHTTISKKNSMVMRSHANNSSVRILQELPNDYLFIEFVRPDARHSDNSG